MEDAEPFYFYPGRLYRISFGNSHGWMPIYKTRKASEVIGRFYEGGICLYTGSTWCSYIQVIYEESIGWVKIHPTMIVEELKEI